MYSKLGEGSSFKVYLPVFATAKPEPARDKPEPLPATHGNKTVMLVEDELAILALGTRMLERMGYTGLAASTPGAALRLAEEQRDEIHLLITDVVMPEMNGRILAVQMTSLYPNLKCLYMSGYTADVIADQGILNQGVKFLQKPFSMEQFSDSICDVLGQE